MDSSTAILSPKTAWNVPTQQYLKVSLRSLLNQEKEEMKKREQEKEIETKNEEDLLFQVAKMGLMDELTLNAILNKFSVKEPNCIVPFFLYISSALGAYDFFLLDALNIKRIVVAASGLPQKFGNAILYKPLPLQDWYGEDILSHLDEAVEFIEEGKQSQSSVLVHCAAGVSRSATVCIAYVMKHQKLSYEEARSLVSKARPVIEPNEGFVRQLQIYERLECDLSNKFEESVLWKLEFNAKSGKETFSLAMSGLDPKLIFRAENVRNLSNQIPMSTLSKMKTNVYCCKSCDRKLFNKLHLHALRSEGEYYVVDRMSWMKTPDVKGELKCPQCNEIFGDYSWEHKYKKKEGLIVESPAFRIEKSKTKIEELNFENFLPKNSPKASSQEVHVHM